MKKLLLISMLALFLVLPFGSTTFASYTQMISFGDSLTDNGNVLAPAGSPGNPNGITNPLDVYGYGVSSNGKVWADYLAEDLGVELLDMAYGASRTTFNPYGDTGFTWQISEYTTNFTVDGDALYTVWIGGNDLIDIMLGRNSATIGTIGTATTAMKTGIQDLVDNGAKNILVMNMPNLGLSPIFPPAATDLSVAYNLAIDAALGGITGTDLKISKLDIFDLMNKWVADFSAGDTTFDNVSDMYALDLLTIDRTIEVLNDAIPGLQAISATLTGNLTTPSPVSDDTLDNLESLLAALNIDLSTLIDAFENDPTDENLNQLIVGVDGLIDGLAIQIAELETQYAQIWAAKYNNTDEKYVFWDAIHPTTYAHRLIADAAYKTVVPEPTTMLLFGFGLLGLAGVSRRKK